MLLDSPYHSSARTLPSHPPPLNLLKLPFVMKQLFVGIVKTIFTGLLHKTETPTDSISSQVSKSFNNQLKTLRAIRMKKTRPVFSIEKGTFW